MKIVGTSQPIHDAVAKATGRAVYAGDMQLPGMLHLAVLFSPIPHGRVRRLDAARALALPGVVDVIHCFNTADSLFNRYRFMKGDDPPPQERVFNRHVRFVGDRVACVIARTPQIARQACDLIEVAYDELPFCLDAPTAAATGVIDEIHEGGAVFGDFQLELGDAADVADGAVATTTTSRLSRVHHITMEPHACVASWDPAMEELTVWSPNQSVHGVRTILGDLFDMPYHQIRVIKTTMGGSFGAKQEWMLEPVAAAAALRVGRPVKLVYSRREAMASTISRCPIDATATSRVTPDGKIQSIEMDVTLDAGAYLGNSYDYMIALSSKLFRFYSYPHARYTGRAVCTNTPVSGAFRGWGSPEQAIILEHNLNMAARQVGIDPLELRLRNTAMPDECDRKSGQPLGPIRARECIQRGRDLFGWEQKRAEHRRFNAAGGRFRRGAGIACGGHVNGYFPRKQDFAGVEMRMTESGSVLVNITLHDHGCGSVTAIRMIVAESLGVPVGMVSVREGDTAITPMDVGCFASRTTYVLGRAAADCAGALLDRLVEVAAQLEQVDPGSLFARDGFVYSKQDTAFSRSYAALALASIRELQQEVFVSHQHINSTNPGVTAAHLAEVEVDTLTGAVRLLDYVAVHDIGQVINREICIAQIQGAVQMGAGAALSEHGDPRVSGMPIDSLKDYHLLNAPEMPTVRVVFIEDGGTDGPFGAKSIGEVSHVPVAPAVVGAVNDALGSDLCALPLNPDRIVAWLAARKEETA